MLTLERALEQVRLIQTIERCKTAIKQYAEAGISGTVHDIEHRKMYDDAIARLQEIDRADD